MASSSNRLSTALADRFRIEREHLTLVVSPNWIVEFREIAARKR